MIVGACARHSYKALLCLLLDSLLGRLCSDRQSLVDM